MKKLLLITLAALSIARGETVRVQCFPTAVPGNIQFAFVGTADSCELSVPELGGTVIAQAHLRFPSEITEYGFTSHTDAFFATDQAMLPHPEGYWLPVPGGVSMSGDGRISVSTGGAVRPGYLRLELMRAVYGTIWSLSVAGQWVSCGDIGPCMGSLPSGGTWSGWGVDLPIMLGQEISVVPIFQLYSNGSPQFGLADVTVQGTFYEADGETLVATLPEPGTLSLATAALAAVACCRRKRFSERPVSR